MATLAVSAWADTASFDFATNGVALFGFSAASSSESTAGDITSNVTATVDGVTFTVTPSTTNTVNRLFVDYYGNMQLRVYGGTITIAAPTGKSVTGVTFYNSKWTAPTPNTGSFTSDNVWSGSASSVDFTVGAQIRLDSVVVTYGDGGGSSDPDQPTLKELNTFYNFSDTVADGTQFKFTGNAIVVYKNDKYTYVRALESNAFYCSALLYGTLSPDYEVGDYIPAGWIGTKTSYKNQTEVTNVTGNTAATQTADKADIEPFDYSGEIGYLSVYPLDEYENDYCIFSGVTLSAIDSNNNFTISEKEYNDEDELETVSMVGYNKFKIDYPTDVTDKVYDVTGLIVHYNETVQFIPTEIAETDISEPLWKVWYWGLDGEDVVVSDTLYVVAATKATEIECNRKNFIYVTDNATMILDDTWADWGWSEWVEWSPDFIALDCGDDTELYNKVAALRVLTPKTVKGVLADNLTNPRIVIETAPEEFNCEYPTIAFNEYNLADTLNANGHEIALITGYYVVKDGKEYLAGNKGEGEDLFQPIELDRRYLGAETLKVGGLYTVKAVIKQKEEWTYDETPALAAKKGATKAQKAKAAKAAKNTVKKAARKMPIYADNYYENYKICPLSIETEPTAVKDVNGAKTISSVKYVNVAGQVSSTPFDGVNMIITTYTDGSNTVAKTVK